MTEPRLYIRIQDSRGILFDYEPATAAQIASAGFVPKERAEKAESALTAAQSDAEKAWAEVRRLEKTLREARHRFDHLHHACSWIRQEPRTVNLNHCLDQLQETLTVKSQPAELHDRERRIQTSPFPQVAQASAVTDNTGGGAGDTPPGRMQAEEGKAGGGAGELEDLIANTCSPTEAQRRITEAKEYLARMQAGEGSPLELCGQLIAEGKPLAALDQMLRWAEGGDPLDRPLTRRELCEALRAVALKAAGTEVLDGMRPGKIVAGVLSELLARLEAKEQG